MKNSCNLHVFYILFGEKNSFFLINKHVFLIFIKKKTRKKKKIKMKKNVFFCFCLFFLLNIHEASTSHFNRNISEKSSLASLFFPRKRALLTGFTCLERIWKNNEKNLKY